MSALVALVSVALAGLIVVAAQAAPLLLAAAVALTVVCLALGWPELVGLEHSRAGTTSVVAVSGLAGVVLAGTEVGALEPLTRLAVVLAAGVLLAFVHQLIRRDGRPDLVRSLAGTVSGQVLTVFAAGWVLLDGTRIGWPGIVIAASAATAAALATHLPLPFPVAQGLRGWVGFGAGLLAGLIALVALHLVTTVSAALPAQLLLAAAVAAVSAGLTLLLADTPSASRPLAVLALGSAPVCAVGTVAYAMARLSGG